MTKNDNDFIRCPKCFHAGEAHYVVRGKKGSMFSNKVVALYCPQCEHRWVPKKFHRGE